MKKILATVLFLVMTAVALSGCLLDSSEASNGKAAIAKQEAKTVDAPKAEEKQEEKPPTLAEQYKMDADFILIKKSDFKLYAVDAKGNIVAAYGCALGLKPGQKEKSGDMKAFFLLMKYSMLHTGRMTSMMARERFPVLMDRGLLVWTQRS